VRAASAEPPQPKPSVSLEAPILDAQALENMTLHLSTVEKNCRSRDDHRCRISRVFDEAELDKRIAIHGLDVRDDNGKFLKYQPTGYLDVAHIIPYSFIPPEGPSVCFPSLGKRVDAEFQIIE
jgi:hypothetical protein